MEVASPRERWSGRSCQKARARDSFRFRIPLESTLSSTCVAPQVRAVPCALCQEPSTLDRAEQEANAAQRRRDGLPPE
jgi:hypothetical protein